MSLLDVLSLTSGNPSGHAAGVQLEAGPSITVGGEVTLESSGPRREATPGAPRGTWSRKVGPGREAGEDVTRGQQESK